MSCLQEAAAAGSSRTDSRLLGRAERASSGNVPSLYMLKAIVSWLQDTYDMKHRGS